MDVKMKLKHIPNILSTIRLLMVIVFALVFFLRKGEYATHLAFLIFGLAFLTDVIDGYLARRFNWVSTLGKILDPLADKLMQCTALICLAIANMVELWFVLPYILKEMLMLSGGLMLMKSRRIVVVSNVLGKCAAVVFFCIMGAVMLFTRSQPAGLDPPLWVNIICIISLLCTVTALLVYFFQYFTAKMPETDKAENNKETINK